MRSVIVAVMLCTACLGSDPFVGTYNVTVSGTETETAPQNQNRTIAGTGTLAVTLNTDNTGYLVTFGEPDYLCKLVATRSTSTPTRLNITNGPCNISGFNGTTTDAGVVVDVQTPMTATLTISYSFSYTTQFVNHAGTGTRTYSGVRL